MPTARSRKSTISSRHDTNSVTSAGANIRFALETLQGWFQRHKVHEGMTVCSEHGPLMETFNQKK